MSSKNLRIVFTALASIVRCASLARKSFIRCRAAVFLASLPLSSHLML